MTHLLTLLLNLLTVGRYGKMKAAHDALLEAQRDHDAEVRHGVQLVEQLTEEAQAFRTLWTRATTALDHLHTLDARCPTAPDRSPTRTAPDLGTHGSDGDRPISDSLDLAVGLGAASLGGGAATASAWTTATMFGAASTGTPIASLHGIAAYNATMAWFGGGALAAGGGGMATGMLVLGGVFVVPALALSSWFLRDRFERRRESYLRRTEALRTETERCAQANDTLDEHRRALQNRSTSLEPLVDVVETHLADHPDGHLATSAWGRIRLRIRQVLGKRQMARPRGNAREDADALVAAMRSCLEPTAMDRAAGPSSANDMTREPDATSRLPWKAALAVHLALALLLTVTSWDGGALLQVFLVLVLLASIPVAALLLLLAAYQRTLRGYGPPLLLCAAALSAIPWVGLGRHLQFAWATSGILEMRPRLRAYLDAHGDCPATLADLEAFDGQRIPTSGLGSTFQRDWGYMVNCGMYGLNMCEVFCVDVHFFESRMWDGAGWTCVD